MGEKYFLFYWGKYIKGCTAKKEKLAFTLKTNFTPLKVKIQLPRILHRLNTALGIQLLPIFSGGGLCLGVARGGKAARKELKHRPFWYSYQYQTPASTDLFNPFITFPLTAWQSSQQGLFGFAFSKKWEKLLRQWTQTKGCNPNATLCCSLSATTLGHANEKIIFLLMLHAEISAVTQKAPVVVQNNW